LEKRATKRSGYASKESNKNENNLTICNTTPRTKKYYQKASNEEMAKHLGANKAVNIIQTLQRSSTICAHKIVEQ
jgi:hypothetical protein